MKTFSALSQRQLAGAPRPTTKPSGSRCIDSSAIARGISKGFMCPSTKLLRNCNRNSDRLQVRAQGVDSQPQSAVSIGIMNEEHPAYTVIDVKGNR